VPAGLPFQPSLFGESTITFDVTFSAARRIHLDETSWLDVTPAWVRGSDVLFERLLRRCRWSQRSRWMYDRRVVEPRLTSPWNRGSGEPLDPVLESMRLALSERYGVVFDSVGLNLYRDGRDGVAWHRDKIRREIADPVVPLVSLGEPRRLLFRPRGGGRSHAFPLGRGDLLVTGGTTQRAWEHAVPKVACAGPRISIAFRYGLDPRAYGREVVTGPPGPIRRGGHA
jgi:alkylated DNA repair dioxygenase AlkB